MHSFLLKFDKYTDTQTLFSKFLFYNSFESMLMNSSFYDKKKEKIILRMRNWGPFLESADN